MANVPSSRIREELAQSEDLVKQVLADADRFQNEKIVAKIRHDLGKVTLSSYGQLESIEINPNQIGFTSGQALGSAIMHAINDGEQRSRKLRGISPERDDQ